MTQKRIKVAILFGGKSAEHEVSLQSAKNIIDAIDMEKYFPILIGIDKSGLWHSHETENYLINPDNPKTIKLNKPMEQVVLIPGLKGALYGLSSRRNLETIDVVFPVLHGPFGEDGTIQGLLRLIDIPFVGAGVLGSAVGMDKDVMKRLLRDGGIPNAKFMIVPFGKTPPSYEEVVDNLGTPFFIKPANLGSSIGICKVFKAEVYQNALQHAFSFDTKVLIEEFIAGREIECSVVGNDNPRASIPGEIIPNHEFYSYEAKYIDIQGASYRVPANIPEMITNQIKETAVKTFKLLGCEGMARVDVFLTQENNVVVNEINTIPGFTSISMYPKLWESGGLSCANLIDILIQCAIKRFKKEKKLNTRYFA